MDKKICLICLREADFSDSKLFLINIFQDMKADPLETRQFSTSEALQIICGITVSKNDGYSEEICSKCHIQLREACQLRQLAQSSQLALHEKLNSKVDVELALINVESDCLICLRETDSNSKMFLKNVFQDNKTDPLEEAGQFSTTEALKLFCGITVSKNDGYPENICSKCHIQLREVFELRQLAQSSQLALHEKLISKVDVEFAIIKIESEDVESNCDVPLLEELHRESADDDADWKSDETADDGETSSSLDFDDETSVPKKKTRRNRTGDVLEAPIYCCGCNKSFYQEFTLRKHSFSMHRRAKNCDSFTKLECHVCFEQFDDEKLLVAHRAGKNELKSLRCEFCLRRFLSTEKFDEHQDFYHVDRMFKCCGCKFRTLKRIDLAEHSLVHQNDNRKSSKKEEKPSKKSSSTVEAYECPVCHIQFETLHQKKLHQWTPYRITDRKRDPSKPRKPRTITRKITVLDAKEHNPHRTVPVCCGCRCLFSSLQELQDHREQSHHPPDSSSDQKGPYECSDCHENFKRKRLFQEHFLRKKFKCSKCDIVHWDLQSMERHSAVHDSERGAFLCCECKVRAVSMDALRKHGQEMHLEKAQRRMQSAETRPFQCEICYRRYETLKLLHVHKRNTYKERKFICKMCGQGHFTQTRLDIHMAAAHATEANHPCGTCGKLHKHVQLARRCESMHRNRRDHACTVCSAVFNTNHHLVTHMLVHTDVRPHKCEVCDKAFKRNYELQMHNVKDHTTGCNFACPLCPERFRSYKSLHKHKLTHTGLPYQCELCDKRFIFRQQYIRHYETHKSNSDKVFQCERCVKRYSQEHFLTNHLKFVHKIKPLDQEWEAKFKKLTGHQRQEEVKAELKEEVSDESFKDLKTEK